MEAAFAAGPDLGGESLPSISPGSGVDMGDEFEDGAGEAENVDEEDDDEDGGGLSPSSLAAKK